MQYAVSALFWVLILGALVYNLVIKKNKNRKAAQEGGDMARVRRAVEPLTHQLGPCQLVYAHWEEQESYARTVKTTYYRYAAAFGGDTLWVIPLGIDKKTGEIQMGQPMQFSPQQLGKITVNAKEKDGAVRRLKVWLGDKQGHTLSQLYVDAENLRKSRWFPVNIAQQEQCEALQRFLDQLAQRVAAENPGVDAIMAAESNEGTGYLGMIISCIGAFIAFFVAPAGLVLSLIGLIMSVVSKLKGAPGKKALIVCGICTAWTVIFTWFFFTYIV